MRTVKLGYVGCGFMAQKVHLPNFTSLSGCEVVALAEVRPQIGETVRQRFDIPKLYSHHLELAEDPEIEAVAVSAGYALQGQMAKDLLARGKAVFMEKPMATSVEQAESILAAEEQGGGRLMLGYMKRYDAGNETARNAIAAAQADGRWGAVTYARNHGFGGDWINNLDTQMDTTDEPMPPSPVVVPDWLPENRANAYLGYLQQYTHNINLLRYLLGAEDRVSVRHVDLDDDGYGGVVIFDMDGVRTTLETGRLAFHRWDEHSQVYFERGWVKATAPPLLLRNQPAEVEIYIGGENPGYQQPIAQPGWTWSYRREAEHFVEAVREGTPFRSSGRDTLTDVRLFEEIYRMWLTARGEV